MQSTKEQKLIRAISDVCLYSKKPTPRLAGVILDMIKAHALANGPDTAPFQLENQLMREWDATINAEMAIEKAAA